MSKLVILGLLISILLVGFAAADNEPDNNDVSTAEKLDKGVYRGSVSYSDLVDFYSLTIKEYTEVKLEVAIIDPREENWVNIATCDSEGNVTRMLEFILRIGSQKDTHTYTHLSQDMTVLWKVEGNGEYEIKVSRGDEGDVPLFCCGLISALGASILLLIAASVIVLRNKRYTRN